MCDLYYDARNLYRCIYIDIDDIYIIWSRITRNENETWFFFSS